MPLSHCVDSGAIFEEKSEKCYYNKIIDALELLEIVWSVSKKTTRVLVLNCFIWL